ncbi:MAG TPA: biotin/lipoyl-containing protein [Bryobacteraceae bacterium]|nr:biotin/lipoyl-containing protein [Bryobacteraceae bacterium]
MKWHVTVGGRASEFSLERSGHECRFQFSGDSNRTASVVEVEPGIYSVLLDGRSYEAKIVPGQDGWYVDIGGCHLAVGVRDPRDAGPDAEAVEAHGVQSIAAPMPGRVVRVLVAEGDPVAAGQGIVVVEAMKMQNEMQAPRTGRIASLRVREGATVSAGEVLAVLE